MPIWRSKIAAAGGWLGFEQFMERALYAPGLGYYSAGAQKLGAGGDFTTAPEISGLFGACVARQCAEVLSSLPEGSILEIGAGSGRLAADVLARLETLAGCRPSMRFSTSAPTCANASAAISNRACRTCSNACAGSTGPPTLPSMASFSPTRFWMHCR